MPATSPDAALLALSGTVFAADMPAGSKGAAVGAGDKVQTVAIPGAEQVVNNYPISVLAGAPETQLAAEFVQLVTSQAGKDVLTAAGFGMP